MDRLIKIANAVLAYSIIIAEYLLVGWSLWVALEVLACEEIFRVTVLCSFAATIALQWFVAPPLWDWEREQDTRRLMIIDLGISAMIVLSLLLLAYSYWQTPASVYTGVAIGIILLCMIWFASGTLLMSIEIIEKIIFRLRNPRYDRMAELKHSKGIVDTPAVRKPLTKRIKDMLKRLAFTYVWLIFLLVLGLNIGLASLRDILQPSLSTALALVAGALSAILLMRGRYNCMFVINGRFWHLRSRVLSRLVHISIILLPVFFVWLVWGRDMAFNVWVVTALLLGIASLAVVTIPDTIARLVYKAIGVIYWFILFTFLFINMLITGV